ncbi:MAG: hypothetical protein ACPHRE_09660 [Pseudomonadales bacterium]
MVNAPESTIARESDVVLPTHAGPEIGACIRSVILPNFSRLSASLTNTLLVKTPIIFSL